MWRRRKWIKTCVVRLHGDLEDMLRVVWEWLGLVKWAEGGIDLGGWFPTFSLQPLRAGAWKGFPAFPAHLRMRPVS